MSYQKSYYPKRPVKSFQDLEVYQKLLALSVAVAKRLTPSALSLRASAKQSHEIAASPSAPRNDIRGKLVEMALDLPVKVATAHSLRFGDQTRAIEALEEVMLNCNILVVYLEQYRDIENKEVENEFFEEQIKNLLTVRMKILHLQNSWKKFAKEYVQTK